MKSPRDGIMPLIVSDKGCAAVEKKRSNRVIIDGIFALVFAAVGCAGYFMLDAEISKSKNELLNVDNPLHDAAFEGHKEVVELLIAKGADVNAKSERGRTSLHSAAFGGHREITELLIAAGADVNTKTDKPLHLAALWGEKEIVELLIAAGAEVNAWDGLGQTALDKAKRKPETADLLRKHGGKTGAELKAEGK